MNNKLKHVIHRIVYKVRYHSYSVPILGWCLRNTVGRRSRSHAVSMEKSVRGNTDTAKVALIVWALHYHPYKQVLRSKFTARNHDFGRKIAVRMDVPSRKSLAKDKKALKA